jgi:hypothetical protein
VVRIWDKLVAICGSSAILRGLTNDVIVAAMGNIGSGVSGGGYPEVQACS